MLPLLSALLFIAPAEELPNRVLLLEVPPSAELDADACFEAIEAHGVVSDLAFEREPADDEPPLRRALERSRAEPTLAVFWLQASAQRAELYLYAPATHAVYVREIDRAEATDAALVEAIGLIAASTATALRSGETLGMRQISEEEWAAMQAEAETRPEPKARPEPEPEPEPEPIREPEVPAPDPPLRLELGVGYRGASFNDAAPWQHGLGARLGLVLTRGIVVELGYAWMAPTSISADVDLQLVRHEPELSAGWRWTFGRFDLDALGLASAEIDRWNAGDRSATRVRGRLGLALRPAVEVGRGVVVEVRVGARAALNAFDFVVCDSPEGTCTGEARTVVASGWRVAPEALIGLSYRFGGASKK